jgi:hypothetical protein
MSTGKEKARTKGFVSFSDVLGSDQTAYSAPMAEPVAEPSNLSPIYRGDDPELAMAAKRLTKKDLTTKLKAFSEAAGILKDRGSVVLPDFLSYFAHIFSRLVLENERRVREASLGLLMVVIAVNKQSLGPFMKHMLPYWWMAVGDPCAEVASAAKSAFESAIPPKKRDPVLLLHYTQIIALMRAHLDHRPETLSDMTSTSQEEAAERYDRVIQSTLRSLSELIPLLSPDSQGTILQDVRAGYPLVLNDR